MKTSKTWKLINRGDFDYLKLEVHFLPKIVFTNHRENCVFDDNSGSQYSLEFPTELLFLNTRFEDGQVYFWVFSFKILGFGFNLTRQTSY